MIRIRPRLADPLPIPTPFWKVTYNAACPRLSINVLLGLLPRPAWSPVVGRTMPVSQLPISDSFRTKAYHQIHILAELKSTTPYSCWQYRERGLKRLIALWQGFKNPTRVQVGAVRVLYDPANRKVVIVWTLLWRQHDVIFTLHIYASECCFDCC